VADPSPLLAALIGDLRLEGDDLDRLVAPLGPDGWTTATPAPGWTIAHQVAHLAWTDRLTLIALTDPDGFDAELRKAAADPTGFVDVGAREGAARPPDALLAGWRQGREALLEAVAALPPGVKAPWFGPPMSGPSVVTGRLMETWAHGQDVADALGVERHPTARLRHIAHLATRTRGYGFLVRGLPVPETPVRVELTAPDGAEWNWGPADAPDRVTGSTLDFCLLVTQRRHRADLAVRAEGADADRWLDVAQTFAGPPGAGRQPGGAR
jgi:uncharacterized protein (TIGR03084 family)